MSDDITPNRPSDVTWAFAGDPSLRIDGAYSARTRRVGLGHQAAPHQIWLQHGPVRPARQRTAPAARRHETADLMTGIELEEFFLEYQPIVAIGSGRLEAFEALLRWRHPFRGVLPPAEFLDDAEQSGALRHLTSWIIEEACSAAAQWNRSAPAPVAVSVNLCGCELRLPDLAANVAAALHSTGATPDQVWFEITEDTGARHARANIEVLHELHRIGTHLALDDFGTGSASIGCLRDLPIDAVKIDRSLVAHAAASTSGARVLAASTEIARALGIRAVAEGIEDADQLELARALGCELGQGFYFGRPVAQRWAERLAMSKALWHGTHSDPASMSGNTERSNTRRHTVIEAYETEAGNA
jgi:EAL domain-containing protein (putative c-di-GMP-specific phosphodiesterase class I)